MAFFLKSSCPRGSQGDASAPSRPKYVSMRIIAILSRVPRPSLLCSPQPGFFYAFQRDKRSTDEIVAFGDSSYLSSLCGACRWSFIFLLGLLNPLIQYGKAHHGLFLSSQQVMSLIQPRPALTDGLGGTKFSLAATDRKR